MLIFLFGTSRDIERFHKLRKSLKEKKRGLYSVELLLDELKAIAAILEIKVKLLKKLCIRNIHIENFFEGYDCSTSDENTFLRELKYANQLK